MNEIKIKKIRVIPNDDVYDICVDTNHNFFANNLLVHNCGEQVLPIGAACLLGSINLTQFVINKNWDYEKLKNVIPIIVRFMDNVNDLTYVPLQEQKESLLNKRRLGLGVMGYGSALMMMKIKYGSKEALKLTDELMEFIKNTTYQSSVNIAKEKGYFKLFDKEKYLSGEFIKNLSNETKKMIAAHGIRNSHILSIQPTGNTSILANIVSGGLEPVFLPVYVRTSIVSQIPDGLIVPTNIDWVNRTFTQTTNKWDWKQEGDDWLLFCIFNGLTYKIDTNRGLTVETIVKDYAVRYLENLNEWDPKADWASTTDKLNIDDHIETMKTLSKHIDSSMSKTINLPKDCSYENFKDVYMKLYDSGTIKGGTTYREGTMASVLSNVKKDVQQSVHIGERPKTLDCDIHHITVNKDEWVVLIGLRDNMPYEVFAFKKKGFTLPKRVKKGKLTKVKKGGVYNLETEDGYVFENVREFFQQDEEQALTRMISLAMRGCTTTIYEIVDQLNKSEGTIVSFSKAIARTLKKYIPDDIKLTDTTCPEYKDPNGLVAETGCIKCKNCGFSLCG
jgi:ribonucleoside-diphosphate reductase alpha chain